VRNFFATVEVPLLLPNSAPKKGELHICKQEKHGDLRVLAAEAEAIVGNGGFRGMVTVRQAG